MDNSQNLSPDEAATLLSQAERSSSDSVHATEVPKPLLFTTAVVFAAIFSLHGMIDIALWYWSLTLFLPLALWIILWARKTVKSRPALKHSGKYMVGVFLLILGTQFSNFWIPQSWPVAVLKFVALFAVLTIAFWIMRHETIKSRMKDGNDQAI